MQTHSPVQGKRFLAALQAAGIEAHNVTRNRRTGVYTVKFCAPNLADLYSPGTLPARVWAKRIADVFDDVEIVDTYDTIAEWRPNKPVLFAQVMVRWEARSIPG